MIIQTLSDLGPWSWFIVGLILLVGEVILPGVFLIWFGLSALVIGTLTLVSFTDVAWWPWQAQLVAFGVLALVLALVGRELFPADAKNDDASKINDPLGRLTGSEASLSEAIVNGKGRVKLGDTTWRVRSANDMPAGARVRVVGNEDGALVVVEA